MTDITTASPALIPFTSRARGTGPPGLSRCRRRRHHRHRFHRAVEARFSASGGGRIAATPSAWATRSATPNATCCWAADRPRNTPRRSPGASPALGLEQHEFDAATDLCFNCGPGSLKWAWAGELAARAVAAAAAQVAHDGGHRRRAQAEGPRTAARRRGAADGERRLRRRAVGSPGQSRDQSAVG